MDDLYQKSPYKWIERDAPLRYLDTFKFYIRKGWLSKGMKNIVQKPNVFVDKNEKHIFAQIADIISQLQSVDVEKIPHNERFVTNMQNRRYPELPCTGCRRVLGHFDMNLGNFLFDDKLNIVSAIDWDAISIANNPETDWRIFMRFWNQYKK